MSKKIIFKGAATALVTPARADGSPDPAAFSRLIDMQIGEGIDALVACGTTGEAATMSEKEYEEIVCAGAEACGGRVPYIVGTGSNSTAAAIARTKRAAALGADAALVVTPYYNKATQKGLIASFTAIAEASPVPLILYNVPLRTGIGIRSETYAELCLHPNIAGIKEACGDISAVAETLSLVGENAALYSGNDDQIVPILALGGKGVISVLSNPLPAKTAEICRRFFEGDTAGSAALQLRLLPLIKALFSEVNPIPAKAAMAALGYGENVLRLPLTPMDEEKRKALISLMRKEGLPVA
ncbi:MAG: 4-hydroxy-tetrahydrodipicolinate synthase [Clostridia bacterium]|nr:4-hydroxy-tetrahydrodipicolinate synthase [Clostridia bacterium]